MSPTLYFSKIFHDFSFFPFSIGVFWRDSDKPEVTRCGGWEQSPSGPEAAVFSLRNEQIENRLRAPAPPRARVGGPQVGGPRVGGVGGPRVGGPRVGGVGPRGRGGRPRTENRHRQSQERSVQGNGRTHFRVPVWPLNFRGGNIRVVQVLGRIFGCFSFVKKWK